MKDIKLDPGFIKIRGAKMHNLKNIDLNIPKNKLVVITGLSGSGKSSLAFDTLYAEGQRRYIESLSSYARQFLGKLNKPKVDKIIGISPAIAIEQKVNNSNPRSTVGTTSEIYDYLKLLYARIGKTFSPISNSEVKKDSIKTVLSKIKSFKTGDKFIADKNEFYMSYSNFANDVQVGEKILIDDGKLIFVLIVVSIVLSISLLISTFKYIL